MEMKTEEVMKTKNEVVVNEYEIMADDIRRVNAGCLPDADHISMCPDLAFLLSLPRRESGLMCCRPGPRGFRLTRSEAWHPTGSLLALPPFEEIIETTSAEGQWSVIMP
jgi:hypothetical protein